MTKEEEDKHQNVPRSALDMKPSSIPSPTLARETVGHSFPSTSTEQSSSMTLPTVIVPYSDTSQNRWLMVYVTLLSGTKASDLAVEVSDCGVQLILVQTWPTLLLDPERLLSRYINEYGIPEYDTNHIIVAGFRTAIRKLKTELSDQQVTSTYRILLPFEVENQLASPPCFNRKSFELLKFENNLVMCAHLREVRTNYNRLQVKDKDFVHLENPQPQIRSTRKAKNNTKW